MSSFTREEDFTEREGKKRETFDEQVGRKKGQNNLAALDECRGEERYILLSHQIMYSATFV